MRAATTRWSEPAIELRAAPIRLMGLAGFAGAMLLARFPNFIGPPCPLRWMTGVPCPSCGMTTSFRAVAALDFPAAFAANPFGPILITLVIALVLNREKLVVRIPLLALIFVLALSWAFQIHRVLL